MASNSGDTQQLILASTSAPRRELLSRLTYPFTVASPQTDEQALAGEAPSELALRLAQQKALSVRSQFPEALIVGSDQVASLDNTRLSKPYTYENARAQLQQMRGRTVIFNTAVCLLNARTNSIQIRNVSSVVEVRDVTDRQIESYLSKEQPYHCAGSAKAEGLGIALLQRVQSDDPTAIIGLPLIALIDMLLLEGLDILDNPYPAK